MSATNSQSIISSKDQVDLLKYLVSMRHDYWHQNKNEVYNSQLGLVKTYLWLAVTFLTALAILHDHFKVTLTCNIGSVSFVIAVISALIALGLGITCLSELFFKAQIKYEPMGDGEKYIKNLAATDYSMELITRDLTALCQTYDLTIREQYDQIKTRAHRMQAQASLLLISVVFSLIFILCFL